MKILFIGGNGNISWYCVEEALKRGHEVWELNRSMTLFTRRDIQPCVHKLTVDIHDLSKTRKLLEGSHFDVVVDFICFNESDAREAISLFKGRCAHFIFISSEAVYKRAGKNLPFKEDCEQNNPDLVDHYIGGKVRAEQIFMDALSEGFPVTIIRPAYTYDVIVPVSIGHNCFTAPQKYLDGLPALIAGDGTNIWAFTHSSDFARALIPLAENPDTIGKSFHIAADEWLSWNEEMEMLFSALGIKEYKAIHVPYEDALELSYFQPRDLMAQRMWHNIYDTSKVKEFVPGWEAKISFEEGIRKTLEWLYGKDVRRRFNERHSVELDKLYRKYIK